MFISKKQKIHESIQNQESKYIGLAGGEYSKPDYKDEVGSGMTSLKNYTRLAEDYGHRRYVRKAAGRIHGRKMY